jgi:hypothetical protein
MRSAKFFDNESLANLPGSINEERRFACLLIESFQSLHYFAINHILSPFAANYNISHVKKSTRK